MDFTAAELAALRSALLGYADDPLMAAVRRHYAREDARPAGATLMASVRDAERRLEEMATRQRGFLPDGSPGSAGFKGAGVERGRAARDEAPRRQRAARQQPG